MSDFDFDELDKAVNGRLDDKKSPRPVTESAPQPREGSPIAVRTGSSSRISSEERPLAAPHLEETTPVAEPAPSVVAPIVRPRSSINRQAAAGVKRSSVIDIMTSPSKRSSREATTIQPVSPASIDEATEDTPASLAIPRRVPTEDAPLRWPPKTDEATRSKETAHSKSEDHSESQARSAESGGLGANVASDGSFERFDSLSRSGFEAGASDDSQPRTTNTQPTPENTPESEPGEPSKTDSVESESVGTQSPFLSDAKVEKRPLGAYSAATPPPEPALTEPSHQAPLTEETPPEEALQAASQPEEAAETATTQLEPVQLDHLLEDGHEHQPVPKEDRSPTSMGSLDSIPQQYKVTEQPHDDTAHKAFDTDEYHAPLHSHEQKQSHHGGGNGLLIASIILLVLAIVAAVGIYFYSDTLGL